MSTGTGTSYKFLFNPYNKDLILSIDGGGMRGVIALAVLCWLEEQTGKPAYELFKLCGGTSTGAIICAGLGIGMSAREIMDEVYKSRLPKAFNRAKRLRWLRFFLNGMRHLYPFGPFLKALGPLGEGKRVGDVDKLTILLTTKDLRTMLDLLHHQSRTGRAALRRMAPGGRGCFQRRGTALLPAGRWQSGRWRGRVPSATPAWRHRSKQSNTWRCRRKT